MQVKFGFNLLQSNQPQLVAYAISDSPVGLMAWMTQLMDPEEVGERFLTNFLIYWLTDTAASSIRLYYENAHDPAAWAPKANSGVPTAVAVFQDGDIAIRRYGEAGNNIVRWTEYPHGGHYAVMTVPQDWLEGRSRILPRAPQRPALMRTAAGAQHAGRAAYAGAHERPAGRPGVRFAAGRAHHPRPLRGRLAGRHHARRVLGPRRAAGAGTASSSCRRGSSPARWSWPTTPATST